MLRNGLLLIEQTSFHIHSKKTNQMGTNNREVVLQSTAENVATAAAESLMAPTCSSPGPFQVARKESYKLQRKNYQFVSKKAANELLFSFKDLAVVFLAHWLKGEIFPPNLLDFFNSFFCFIGSQGNVEELVQFVVHFETRCDSPLQKRQGKGTEL